MEFESETGSKITLQKGQKLEIGRGLGFDSTDPTLSRRQISLSLQQSPNSKSRVQFEVIGKNPIWVYEKDKDKIRVLKRSEKGEMVEGDRFCLSWKKPVWFSVRGRGDKREIGGVVDLDMELKSIDFSDFDPVKEFGFFVIGHEFDHYPKHKIRPPKTWDWFLEKSKKESDDDDDEISGRKRSKSRRRKRKKADVDDGEDDDEWTGESEEDKELILKSGKVKRPNYSTRSKDRKSSTSTQKKIAKRDEDDNDEDEDEDETLGGFIVSDDEVKKEEDDDETELDDEEEEEDFDEED